MLNQTGLGKVWVMPTLGTNIMYWVLENGCIFAGIIQVARLYHPHQGACWGEMTLSLAVNCQVGGAPYLGWGREEKVAWVCPVPNHVLMPIDQGSCYWIFAMEGMVAFAVGGCLVLILVLKMTWLHQAVICGSVLIGQGQDHGPVP